MVIVDTASADRKQLIRPLIQGQQYLDLPKGGLYGIGFVYNPIRATANKVQPRSISSAISLIGNLSMMAGQLNSLPTSTSAASEVQLGTLQQTASGDGYVSAATESEIAAAIGRTQEEIATVGAYDSAYIKLLNPDIDMDGIYDTEEELKWSVGADFRFVARYTLGAQGIAGPIENLVSNINLKIRLQEHGQNLVSTNSVWELALPPGVYFTDDHGIRTEFINGYYGSDQYHSADPAMIAFKDFPLCTGDLELRQQGVDRLFRFQKADFYNIGTGLEGWIFPVLVGSIDSAGKITSGHFVWKKIKNGETIDISFDEAFLVYERHIEYLLPGKSSSSGAYDASNIMFDPPLSPLQPLLAMVFLRDGSSVWYDLQIMTDSRDILPDVSKTWSVNIDRAPSAVPEKLMRSGDLLLSTPFPSLYDASVGNNQRFLVELEGGEATIVASRLYSTDMGMTSLSVFDISHPASPILKSKILLPMGQDNRYNESLIAVDHALYVCGGEKLLVFDISNPDWPLFISAQDSRYRHSYCAGGPSSLGAQAFGDRLYFQTSIFDISDRLSPVYQSTLPIDADISFPDIPRILYTDRYVFMSYRFGSQSSIRIFDCAKPGSPVELAPIDGDAGFIYFLPGDILGDRNYRLFDISKPSEPIRVSAGSGIDLYGCADAIVLGDTLYGIYNDGISIIDVSKPLLPTPSQRLSWSLSRINGICVIGDFAITSRGDSRILSVASVSENGATLLSQTTVADPGAIRGIFTCTGNLYVIAGNYPDSRLYVYSLSNGSLSLQSTTNLGVDFSYYRAYARLGSLVALFGSSSSGGVLLIVDLTDPLSPRVRGNVQVQGSSIAFKDAYIYVAGANQDSATGGIRIIDCSDYDHPVLVKTLGPMELGGAQDQNVAESVYVYGDFAYVTDLGDTLRVFRCDDPLNPVVVRTIINGHAVLNTYNDRYLLGTGRVLNIRDPSDPQVIQLDFAVDDVFCLSGTSLYTVDASGYLIRYDFR